MVARVILPNLCFYTHKKRINEKVEYYLSPLKRDELEIGPDLLSETVEIS